MKLRLVLADCEVAAVAGHANGADIRFSAAHVEGHSDDPGDRPTDGYSKGVWLHLTGAALKEGDSAVHLGRLSRGRVLLDGSWTSTLPLPMSPRGPGTVELEFANGSRLVLAATSVACRFEGDANFAESLSC